MFFKKLVSHDDPHVFVVSCVNVCDALSKQKRGKSSGPDGISMAVYMFGGSRLIVHLTLIFNVFLMQCHLPAEFMKSTIVPLVKCIGGDLTNVDNCHGQCCY